MPEGCQASREFRKRIYEHPQLEHRYSTCLSLRQEARLSPAGAVTTVPYILPQALICIPIRSREKIERRSFSTNMRLVLDIDSVTTIVAVSSCPSSYPEEGTVCQQQKSQKMWNGKGRQKKHRFFKRKITLVWKFAASSFFLRSIIKCVKDSDQS